MLAVQHLLPIRDGSPSSSRLKPLVLMLSVIGSMVVMGVLVSVIMAVDFRQHHPHPAEYGAASASTCLGRCGDKESPNHSCQCNTYCTKFGDCCGDYDQYCIKGTCLNRCGDRDSSYPCNCDDNCDLAGDCCTDYIKQCKPLYSCDGRCSANYDVSLPCQCNVLCPNYGNCCFDYMNLCSQPTPTPTPQIPVDISAFATAIWAADVNRAVVGSEVVVNHGSYISDSYAETDLSSSRLFTSVDASVLERPTFKTMIKLFDNYITKTGSTESSTSTEIAEEGAFLDAIFDTDVMKLAYQFVKAKNYFSGTLSEYKEFIRGLLFDPYSRKVSHDSSGFEHVFVGEWQDSTSVSGFHNWVQLYLLEKSGQANYHGYMKKQKHNIVKFQFKWSGRVKPVTTSMIGASPEFEVALFSTCFLKAPNAVCPLQLNGHNADIQTYDYKGADVLGSAYFRG